jgi:general secretion pathway protein D
MRYTLVLMFAFPILVHAAERLPIPPLPKGATLVRSEMSGKAVKFDLQGVGVAQVISLVYAEALKQPYVIDPAVLKDERSVSFRFDAEGGNIKPFWHDFLDALGIAVEMRNGVDFVTTKRPEEKVTPGADAFVYRPKYRSTSYLADLLSPLFKSGSFTVMRAVHVPPAAKVEVGAKSAPAPAGSAAATIDQDSDTLIFQGTADEIVKLKRLFSQVDTRTGEVVIKAVVYEVATSENDGSAFSLAVNLLGNRLGVKLGDASMLANSIAIKAAGIDAAYSILADDSRFKAVSTPHLRVKSGAQAHLSVGQDVPTLGAVSYPQGGGPPVQSIEYRSSGVILDFSPVVHEAGVDLTVDQQISDFVKTETGVNNSPTLTKRALSTTVTLADGELIVLGGLTQEKGSSNSAGMPFLPKILWTSNHGDSRTEVLVLLQVMKVGS